MLERFGIRHVKGRARAYIYDKQHDLPRVEKAQIDFRNKYSGHRGKRYRRRENSRQKQAVYLFAERGVTQHGIVSGIRDQVRD